MLDPATSKRVRRAAILGAIASWASVGLLVVVALSLAFARAAGPAISTLTRALVLAGVSVCFALWALALLEAWPVRCPHCDRRLLLKYRLSSRGGTAGDALHEQFCPRRLLRESRTTCPHCAAVIDFAVAGDG